VRKVIKVFNTANLATSELSAWCAPASAALFS
jgi:hypothetical protein